MASSSKIYIDLSTIEISNPLRIVLYHIKHKLNQLVDHSYAAMNIKEMEVGRVPLIRNSARASSFIFTPELSYEHYSLNFSHFVHEELVGGFPQKVFKHIKNDVVPSHQYRSITINYGHTDNGLESHGITEKNNHVLSISMADDIVGQTIIGDLSQLLKKELPELLILIEESSLREDEIHEVKLQGNK